jgi:hypothetical protein
MYVASITPSVKSQWKKFVSAQNSTAFACSVTPVKPERNSKANIRLYENRLIAMTTMLKYNGCASVETLAPSTAKKSSVANRTWTVVVQSTTTIAPTTTTIAPTTTTIAPTTTTTPPASGGRCGSLCTSSRPASTGRCGSLCGRKGSADTLERQVCARDICRGEIRCPGTGGRKTCCRDELSGRLAESDI